MKNFFIVIFSPIYLSYFLLRNNANLRKWFSYFVVIKRVFVLFIHKNFVSRKSFPIFNKQRK